MLAPLEAHARQVGLAFLLKGGESISPFSVLFRFGELGNPIAGQETLALRAAVLAQLRSRSDPRIDGYDADFELARQPATGNRKAADPKTGFQSDKVPFKCIWNALGRVLYVEEMARAPRTSRGKCLTPKCHER